jgi:hypothetical protein
MLQKRLAAVFLVFSSGSIKKATGGFKNLHSEKIRDLCLPPNIIGIKSRMCVLTVYRHPDKQKKYCSNKTVKTKVHPTHHC